MKFYSHNARQLIQQGSLKKFYFIYLVAFAVIALIAVCSQLLIQNYLGKQAEDSYLINVAGKQRMLSQKIVKNLLFYHSENSTRVRHELTTDFQEWSSKHQLLKTGELIDHDFNTPQIDTLYEKLDVFFQAYASSLTAYLADKNTTDFNSVLMAEGQYLVLMDRIVNAYDHNYQTKLVFLRRVEFGLAVFLILILIFEMVFVFLPLIKTLERAFNSLISSEKSAKELADNLHEAKEGIELKNKEISDMNRAIEKATIVVKTDNEGRIVSANQAYQQLTDYPEDELVGRPLFYNNQGGAESIIYEHIKNQNHKDRVWQGEVRDTGKSGNEFWLDVTLFPIVDIEGYLYEYLVICSDSTKRKQAENELKTINEIKFIKQEEGQKLKSKSIIAGQEAERKRMALEVHDGLGQMLTALKFTCEAVESKDEAQEKIHGRMKSLLQDVIRETRRISSDLLPTVLTDFGMVAGMKELIAISQKSTEIDITFRDNLNLAQRLSLEKEIAVYRITQEALNNSMKYAQASEIAIVINNDAEYVTVSIEDDGLGIPDLMELMNATNNKKGNGLRNMRERATLIEGSVLINTKLTKGTQVFLEFPIE